MSNNNTRKISSKRKIGDVNIFNDTTITSWEKMYDEIMDEKYKKNTRKFTKTIHGKKTETPHIYLIPRERGGPSYKNANLIGDCNTDIQYCPISKGFSMQDLSSFTLGPIIGEGLCLVNAAFSKSICIMHIEGGGVVDLNRKNFWKCAKKPTRVIKETETPNIISVDNVLYNKYEWLKNNEVLWMPQWEEWRKCVALCSMGDFHWARLSNGDYSPTLCFRYKNNYIDFIEWKKECYIKPSYELMPFTKPYIFIENLYKTEKISIGLVHPMAFGGEEKPITKEFIKELFDSEYDMCCQPFVVAGKLLGVEYINFI